MFHHHQSFLCQSWNILYVSYIEMIMYTILFSVHWGEFWCTTSSDIWRQLMCGKSNRSKDITKVNNYSPVLMVNKFTNCHDLGHYLMENYKWYEPSWMLARKSSRNLHWTKIKQHFSLSHFSWVEITDLMPSSHIHKYLSKHRRLYAFWPSHRVDQIACCSL